MITENSVVIDKNCHPHHHLPKLCWSAVIAGAFVGVGLGFLLHLFSIAIGLSAYSSSPDGATAIAIGGILGLLIGVIASMAAGGFVAGYLGRFHYFHCHGGVIYGFVTWSLALLLSAIFIIPLTHYITSYTREIAPIVVVAKPVVVDGNNAAANTVSASTVKETKVITNHPANAITPDTLAGAGWIIFALFFIGALSSCIGACCGMNCKRQCLHPSTVSTEPPVAP